MVGVEGFEPPTSCSQSRRATGLRYTPLVPVASRSRRYPKAPHGTHRSHQRQRGSNKFHPPNRQGSNGTGRFRAPLRLNHIGAPGEIRTPDHQVRSLVLYPTELRAQARSGIMDGSSELVNTPCDFFSHDASTSRTKNKRSTRDRCLTGGERGIRTLDKAFDPILP